MKNSRLILFAQIGILLACALLISCSNDSNPVMPASHQTTMNSNPMTTANATSASRSTSTSKSNLTPLNNANPNGAGGDMPAYYDDELFTINFKELPSGGEQSNINHNGSINTIYMCDQCDATFMFISVLDAIQREGFNPLWQEVQIVFNAGHTPHQFTSDNDILAAVGTGEIHLVTTSELYRCAVVGKK